MKYIILSFAFSILVLNVNAQFLKDKKLTKYDGYFNFHYEEKQDKIYLEVKDLDKDFLYVNSLSSGIGNNDLGLDRGQLGNTRIVHFKKAGNKLLLIQPNQNYRANTDNELERKSIEQAFAKSVLYGFKILESNENGHLIDFTSFLMQDAHNVANRLKRANEGSYSVDVTKSALSLERTKAFPKNVEFEALLTFKGQPAGSKLRSVTPTASLVTVIQHHSFIELPDNNYKPREFDVRSGAIPISYMDYATPVQEQIRKRFIRRHRLEKKNPAAEISEAVDPIIYYLDSGTPEPVRSALLEGGRWWNQAFEAIGFKDAFRVKMLPPGADPLDCRYNMIQWVHRSTRGWSYGASVVDPRTGEIIKGHVSLGSLRIRQDFMIAQALMDGPFAKGDSNYQPMLNMAIARIRQLSAHEIGHTLGFAHNFAASTNDRASVMDYPHPTLTHNGNDIDFSNAYDIGIGEWDKVTVAYSYSQFVEATDEKQALNNILESAYKSGLRFITDSDARAQGGAHALAHLWDNGKSAAEELQNVLKIREIAMSNFSEDNIRTDDPYTVLDDVFVPLFFFHRYQTEATAKLIGGLDYNYAVKGSSQFTVNPIDGDKQREALNSLLKTLDAKTLAIPEDKLSLFPPRAFAYGRTRESIKGKTGVAFDPLSAASTASDMTLGLLLHPERANRLIQQQSLDRNQLNLDQVLNQLVDMRSSYNYPSYLNEVEFMVHENVLKHIMNLASSGRSFTQVKAIAYSALDKAEKNLSMNKPYDAQLLRMISQFKKEPAKFKVQPSPQIPDGSPIGSDICNYNPN
ncbi:MAG: zinc-dependent metalloprotease [Flavobacteriaceae bacterium]|nr:zinc-dependent metalloprotease [Flavobacteriaceae bacterium]